MKGKASKLQVLIGIFIMFVSAFVSTPRAVGQTVNGNILGTVHDQQGAVVPNASVSAKNLGTAEERTAISDAFGSFNIVSIPAGSYVVTASATGFQTEVRSGITLTVGAALRVDFTLNVGAVSEKVEVTGEAPQVDTTTSTMAGLVSDTVIRELPLNGRDWLQLATLQSGVQQIATQNIFDKGPTFGMGIRMSISGGRPSHNLYRIDGLVVNDQTNNSPGGALGANMGVDSIREFSVLTNTYSAEYGRSSGGVINAITKSGTNDLHGTAFYFGRNSALDARNFFDKQLPPFRRHQFGASVGGPIKKDKLFYFANYEGLRQLLNGSGSSSTLSPAARNGILCVGPSIPNCPTTQVAVDPRVVPYLALYPLPNSTLSGNTGLFVFAQPQLAHEDYVSGRIDYLLGSKTTLSGGYTFDNTNITTADAFDEKLVGTRSRNQRVVLNVQHIFSAAVLNTTRGGFTRTAAARTLDESPFTPLLTDPKLGFVPGMNVGIFLVPGLDSFGGIGAGGSDIIYYTAPQLNDDLVWVKGRNNIRIGFSIEDIRDDVFGLNVPAGQWTFNSIPNLLTVTTPQIFTVDFPGTDAERGVRTKLFGVYFQDDLRLRPNLTVNLGLRWEPSTSITEVNGKNASLLNMTDAKVFIGNPMYHSPSKRAFGPRVGFAWDPFSTGKTVIRSGFGVYDVPEVPSVLNSKVIRAAPFFLQGNFTNPPASSFPNGAFSLFGPASSVPTTGLRTNYIEPYPHLPYKLQWNFNIEHQVTKSLAIIVGYVGSRGVHLPIATDDADQVPAALVTTAPGGQLMFPTTGTIQRINPNWAKIPRVLWNGYSTYHALQVNVSERMSHGITFQGAYVWAKNIDIGDAEYASQEFTNSIGQSYAFAPNLDRGPADFDIGQHVSANFVWDAPHPATMSLLPRLLLSGWQLSGIFTAQSGPPLNVRIAADRARTGASGLGSNAAGQRPNYNPAPGCTPNATNPGNFQNYINLSCLSFPALGTLGNLGRGALRGPGLEDVDFSLVKNGNLIGERLKVQFRAEFFNVLNRSNLRSGEPTVFDGSGNLILASAKLNLGTDTTSRQIQFGLKFIW